MAPSGKAGKVDAEAQFADWDVLDKPGVHRDVGASSKGDVHVVLEAGAHLILGGSDFTNFTNGLKPALTATRN